MLDIRRRLFTHFQRLSIVVPRALHVGPGHLAPDLRRRGHRRPARHGLINLITSVLLDRRHRRRAARCSTSQLALVTLAAFPMLFVMTRWFRNHSEQAYRATREAVALVIVHFVESLGGIQAVHAFRREPRNQEIFEHLDDRYRDANVWSNAAGRHVRARRAVRRPAHHRDRAAVRRLPGARRRDHRRRARRLPALPAPVLRADGGAEPVLQPVPGARPRPSRSCRACSRSRRRCPSRVPTRCRSPTPQGARRVRRASSSATRERSVLHHLDLDDPGRSDRRARRRHRRGQDHDRPARSARFWDPTDGRVTLDGDRPARPVRGRPAAGGRHRDPGELPVLRLGRRQHRARPAGRDAGPRSRHAARAIGAHEFIADAARRLRHRRPPEGRPAVGRPAPAGRRSPAPSSPTRPC